MRAGRIALAAIAATALAGAGCGDGDQAEAPAQTPETPAPSPIIRIAVEGPVATLDPVFARTRAERLISRQIHEPLVTRISPPFGVPGARRGPARSIGAADGGRQWRYELRPGVVFHDGAPLDGDAVEANYERWVQTGIAGRLLPELEAVFTPRPGEVRFQLSRPVPDFPRRLARAPLGLVSPESLTIGATPLESDAAGTGPYSLDQILATGALVRTFPQWWGERLGLGPGINQLEFRIVPRDVGRLEQLIAGEVAVADELGPQAVERLQRQPLLATVSDGSLTMGISGSLRGLSSVDVDQSLSQLWLTELR